VNTFTFQEDGIFADNTDGIGWLNDLTHAGSSIHNKSVCILGAGGAAAGICPVIVAQSPASLIIANRSRGKAEQLLDQYTDTRFHSMALEELLEVDNYKFDLLINATSIGHQGKHPDLVPKLFNPGAFLYDLNYGPAAEPLKYWCQQNNIHYHDGLGMLVEQAALAFELWTGNRPETQTVLADLREKLSPQDCGFE
jgi:shikimate dehydrogenase